LAIAALAEPATLVIATGKSNDRSSCRCTCF
jgi:hypothetical protein